VNPKCSSQKFVPSELAPLVIEFNSTDDKVQFITLDKIKEMFDDDLKCPILTAAVFQDEYDQVFNKEIS
jgi:hypothetical protein